MVTGFVFYQGPSEIDGKPIVGIATFGTSNAKTGNLVQTWIMRSDIHPVGAINSGEDSSVCGTCPLRGLIRPVSERISKSTAPGDTTNKGRSCYVLIHTAPNAVWNSYHNNKYPTLSDQLPQEQKQMLFGKGLRYGSYGDPVAIPMENWNFLAKFCTGKAEPGYTHQWKDKRFKHWSKKLMASTHTIQENKKAQKAGWRTFRTINNVTEIDKNEIVCPASAEGKFTATCETCGACNGKKSKTDQRRSIAIVAHGSGGKTKMIEKLINA